MLAKNKSTKNLVYVLVIPIFLVVLSAFTFKSYPVYKTSDGQIVQDTLIPGSIFVKDTVVSFDTNTKEERIDIVSTEISMNEYINRHKFSGKLSSRIDTIPTYDPVTYHESLVTYKVKYPYELRMVFHKFSGEQQDAIIKHYGSMTKEVVKE